MSDHSGPPGPQLPDFSADRGREDTARGRPPHGGPDIAVDPGRGPGPGPGRGPLLALLLGGGVLVVAVVAVTAVVLSLTVFRTSPEAPAASGRSSTSPSDTQSEEPGGAAPAEGDPADDEEPGIGEDGDITLAEEPTTACTTHRNEVTTEQADGVVRGGGLEFPVPEGWEAGTDWGSQSSYLTDQSFADQKVESGWYAVSGVGAVSFPEEEGGYPGAQEAAREIFLCGLGRDQAEELYGDPVEMVDYREEEFTVDGHDAWIVSADVQISDLALLYTTDAWRRVVIVVDTPEGPAAFDGGAALGHRQQVADLETMFEGLRVL